MKISVKGFIYHKESERFEDCFDRYGINSSTNKFAISDGVSKSFFPDIWANILVNSFINNEKQINLTDYSSYQQIQEEWKNKVKEIVNKPNQKYFVKNFFAQGRSAAATFVGLHFFEERDCFKWEAIALGDSFLFFVPDNVENITKDFEKVSFLSSKKDFEFNNFPDFFDSRDITNKGKIKIKKGDLKAGTFLLMTDALAEWFISEKQNALDIISTWSAQDFFEDSIKTLRKTTLYNDDTAILIIEIHEDQNHKLEYQQIKVTDYNELLDNEKSIQINQETREQESMGNNLINLNFHLPNRQAQTNTEPLIFNIKKSNIRPVFFWERLVLYPLWVYKNFYTQSIDKELISPLNLEKTNEENNQDEDISPITDKF